MATKISFSTVDKIVDQDTSIVQKKLDDKQLYFELNDCANYINENDFEKVALQFPDELMVHSTFVATFLEDATKKKIYILADTSYGSCCIDEVAASHYNADLIVHFGQTCLTNVAKLPVYYVFGREIIKVDNLLSQMKKQFQNSEKNILLFFDVQYCHSITEIENVLQRDYPNIEVSRINKIIGNPHTTEGCESKFGRSFKLKCKLEENDILFIGTNERTLYNFIVTFNRNKIYSFNPETDVFQEEGLTVNKYLMRRFYLIEKAKDAQIVGIVMGTLGVARYGEMVTRLKQILKNSGKKFYTFIVGKINPAKLANFMEIDIFVLVACPENSLIDSKEFYKPIITPYEMEIACVKSRSWTGDYVTDFRDLLPGSNFHVDVSQQDSDEEPEYSLITGKLRSNNNAEESLCTDVATRNEVNSLVVAQAKSASEYLSQRTWQGLQIDPDETEVNLAVKGRSGIAMNYKNEPED